MNQFNITVNYNITPMQEVLSWLNNRELSIIIWFLLILIFVLVWKETRQQIIDLFLLVITSQIGTVLLLCTAYMMILILGLQKIGYWEMSLSKDAVIWLFGFAFYSTWQINEQKNQGRYFKSIVFDAVKIITIVHLITGTYVMGLIAELIFIPTIVVLSLLAGGSSYKEKEDDQYKPVTKFFNFLIFLLVSYVLYTCICNLFVNPNELFSIIKSKEFTLPIILTLGFLPLLYCIGYYIFYEGLASRLKYQIKTNRKLIRYAKTHLLLKSRFSIDRLKSFDQKLRGKLIESREEFDLRILP